MPNFFDPSIPSPDDPPAWVDQPPPPVVDPYADPAAKVVSIQTREPIAPGQPSDPALWESAGGWSEADIPPRPWIIPGLAMRGAVTVIAGPGSAGKSSFTKALAVAAVLGRPYSRWTAQKPISVLSMNVEDDLNEERRRIAAACRQFGVTTVDLPDSLKIVGPAAVGTLLERDQMTGRLRLTEAASLLEQIISADLPDIVILDPLVELHTAEENDNTAVRAVMAWFRGIATRYDIAVILLHHTAKGVTVPGNADALRGASSIVGAARIVLTVCPMGDDDADKLGIGRSDRRDYFRVDDAKANYSRLENATWFQRVPHQLSNGETIAAAEPWTPPSPWEGVTWGMIDQIAAGIRDGMPDGERWTSKRQAGDRWAGVLVQRVTGKSEVVAVELLRSWIESGLLIQGQHVSPSQRRPRVGLTVDEVKLSDIRASMEAP